MSNTGLEEKVESMNVDEKEAKNQKGGRGGEKAKGEKKKKDDHSSFPLEVSSFTRGCMRFTASQLLRVNCKFHFIFSSGALFCLI